VHWNGQTWSAPSGPPLMNLYSVWASAPDDVWAFGYDHSGLAALRWNGQVWAKTELLDYATIGVSASPAVVAPDVAWGSGRDDVWVSVITKGVSAASFFAHWDGLVWSLDGSLANVAPALSIRGMWGNGPQDVWAVGAVDGRNSSTGGAVHWDGVRWSPVTSLSQTDLADSFSSVWSSGPNDIWIGGAAALHHWDGVSWSRPLSTPNGSPFLVAGSGPADVWAVTTANDGTAVASYWNGLVWRTVVVPGIVGTLSVAAISPTNAWMRSDDTTAHWDGTTWALSDAGTNFLSSNLSWSGEDIWTISMRGLIRHP